MARIMAIDYGTKRVGIAVTDPLQMIATSLTTIHSKDVVDFLTDYFNREPVETIVIGDPRPLGNESHKTSDLTDIFVKKLRKNFPDVKICRLDERFTSKEAQRVISGSGMGKIKRQEKGLVDKVSATIILQDFMMWNK